ncbi:hypothetical protein [Fluoribacter gormanii]|uniref:hypothetical protein n=1 Tax=Fluoribacter gormanii TaxID=464 RepID=UPI001041AF04|nr:hypothetical protein [Fluoribacter gormanii]
MKWIFSFIIGIFFLMTYDAFAKNMSSGKLITHNEWITGNIKLTYTFSDINAEVFHKLKSKVNHSGFSESATKILIHPSQEISVVTLDKERITTIKSRSFVEIYGYTHNEPGYFNITRKLCIRSHNYYGCANINEDIFADEYILNMKSLDLEAFNLPTGDYLATIEVLVESDDGAIGYLSDGNTEFTIQAP